MHGGEFDVPPAQDPCSWEKVTWTRPACRMLHRAYRLGLLHDDLYIDVGAHGGGELRLARSSGHPYIGFECNYAEYRKLRDRHNDDSNVTLINACVSDAPGLVKLYNAMDSSSLDPDKISSQPSALEKAIRDQEAHIGSSKRVAKSKITLSGLPFQHAMAITLDQVMMGGQHAAPALPHIGFLKIDVQGHEAAVLRGSVALLRRHRPFVYYEDNMLPSAERNGTILHSLVPGYDCDCRICEIQESRGKKKHVCSESDCFCAPPKLSQ